MKLKDILDIKNGKVVLIKKGKTVYDAIKILVEQNIGALLVVEKSGNLAGIITERDILRESAERDNLLRKTKVEKVMTKDLIIGLPEDDIEYIMGILTKNRIRHLPVLDGGNIVGIISIGDVVKAQLQVQEFDNRYLKQYMFGH